MGNLIGDFKINIIEECVENSNIKYLIKHNDAVNISNNLMEFIKIYTKNFGKYESLRIYNFIIVFPNHSMILFKNKDYPEIGYKKVIWL